MESGLLLGEYKIFSHVYVSKKDSFTKLEPYRVVVYIYQFVFLFFLKNLLSIYFYFLDVMIWWHVMGYCYFSSKGRGIQTRVRSGVLLFDVLLLDIIFLRYVKMFYLYYITFIIWVRVYNTIYCCELRAR